MPIKRLTISIVLLLVASTLSLAQNRLDVGLHMGVSYYYGEYNENRPLYKSNLSFGAIFRHNMSDYYSLRGSLDIGRLSGQHSGEQLLPKAPGGAFSRSLLSTELMLEFNFFPLNPVSLKPQQTLTPYINVGAGIALVQTQLVPNIPFGGGLKFTPGNRHTAALEWMFHKTFTDHIDHYEAPREGRHALLHNHDWFSVISLIYTYRLPGGNNSVCPVYR